MRYREDLAPVLTAVTCNIEPKEKIGVVGRTGAGRRAFSIGFRVRGPHSPSREIQPDPGAVSALRALPRLGEY